MVLLAGSALLVISHHQGSPVFFRTVFKEQLAGHPAAAALGYFWWFASCLVLFVALPLLLSWMTGGSFTRRYGLGLGDWRAGFGFCALFFAVMLPIVYVAARSKAFSGSYPLAGQGAFTLARGEKTEVSLALFAAYEAGYFAYFIGWEFFFRGWMLNALLPRFGRSGAVLIPTVPFVVMHLGKPELEALGSIVAGVALGVLALRTRSFWYGAFLHGVIAVWMDLLLSLSYLRGP